MWLDNLDIRYAQYSGQGYLKYWIMSELTTLMNDAHWI